MTHRNHKREAGTGSWETHNPFRGWPPGYPPTPGPTCCSQCGHTCGVCHVRHHPVVHVNVVAVEVVVDVRTLASPSPAARHAMQLSCKTLSVCMQVRGSSGHVRCHTLLECFLMGPRDT